MKERNNVKHNVERERKRKKIERPFQSPQKMQMVVNEKKYEHKEKLRQMNGTPNKNVISMATKFSYL